jgi:tetratricopeptide (TPR) repeat protein
MSASRNKRFLLTCWVIGFVLCAALAALVLDVRAARAASGQAPTGVLHVPELDAGFHLLYELKFEEARGQFETWEKSHPQDPLGHTSEAASYLFEECYRQGVLTSDFFLDDKRFLGKIPLEPDPQLRAAFFASDKRAQDLAELRLKTYPDDPNALFAMSLSLGMQADYASLIDKRQLDSLKKIREADRYSRKLLKVAPDAADAYLGLGTANYIIGSLPGPKKFFLGFAGIHGDKKKGIEQLETVAKYGHYLRPFAKILLALTALREKKPEVARSQLTELVAEFPENTLFASELAKLNVPSAGGVPGIIWRGTYACLDARLVETCWLGSGKVPISRITGHVR